MKDDIFWPDRSASEVIKLQQEAVDFFESVIKRSRNTDRIFWPDLDNDEAIERRRAGEQFFQTVVRRKK